MSEIGADFTFIRYANCWEDADLLMQNLRPKKGESILSIASAGDNSLAFLAFDPENVLAFDINDTQLFISELKQKAIEHLVYEEVLEFLGFRNSNKRLEYYARIKPHLNRDTELFFSSRLKTIESGVIYSGKFEKYFSIFRNWILPILHTKKTINALFLKRNASTQEEFYNNVWNNRRWRWLFKIFFSKTIMGWLGRDPSFFNEVQKNVGEEIYRRAGKHLSSEFVSKNYFLDFQLRGCFNIGLPFYIRPENFEKIKSNIRRIEWIKGYLTDIPANKKFDCLNLSNIFEYMNPDMFREQASHIKKLSTEDSRIAYWNLLVERDLSDIDQEYKKEVTIGNDLCFFYHTIRLNSIVN